MGIMCVARWARGRWKSKPVARLISALTPAGRTPRASASVEDTRKTRCTCTSIQASTASASCEADKHDSTSVLHRHMSGLTQYSAAVSQAALSGRLLRRLHL
ncbi:hypothetical protein PENSPDRAFT_456894 [Peniophora sp. CONT]|nr:hypothetical protein PENSPDRAFT_456894 [Peniophora sp. CONT]